MKRNMLNPPGESSSGMSEETGSKTITHRLCKHCGMARCVLAKNQQLLAAFAQCIPSTSSVEEDSVEPDVDCDLCRRTSITGRPCCYTAPDSTGKKWQCLFCDKVYVRKGFLLRHQLKHFAETPTETTRETPAVQSLPQRVRKQNSRRHQTEKHQKTVNVKVHQCKGCRKNFRNLSNLKAHQAQSCNKSKSDKLSKQERSKSQIKIFECDICKKTFPSKSVLEDHKNFHTGTKPYGCLQCGKFFSWKCNFVTHKAAHRDPDLLKCKKCSKSFTTKYIRMQHEKLQCDRSPDNYKCDICGAAYKRKYYYLLHKQTHTKAGVYRCEKCKTNFLRKEEYKAHEAHARGQSLRKFNQQYIYRYNCGFCCKQLRYPCLLKNHELKHTNAILYQCNDCEKTYKSRKGIMDHVKMHLTKESAQVLPPSTIQELQLQQEPPRKRSKSKQDEDETAKKRKVDDISKKRGRPKQQKEVMIGTKETTSRLQEHQLQQQQQPKKRSKPKDEDDEIAKKRKVDDVRRGRPNRQKEGEIKGKRSKFNSLEFVCEVCTARFSVEAFYKEHLKITGHKRYTDIADSDKQDNVASRRKSTSGRKSTKKQSFRKETDKSKSEEEVRQQVETEVYKSFGESRPVLTSSEKELTSIENEQSNYTEKTNDIVPSTASSEKEPTSTENDQSNYKEKTNDIVPSTASSEKEPTSTENEQSNYREKTNDIVPSTASSEKEPTSTENKQSNYREKTNDIVPSTASSEKEPTSTENKQSNYKEKTNDIVPSTAEREPSSQVEKSLNSNAISPTRIPPELTCHVVSNDQNKTPETPVQFEEAFYRPRNVHHYSSAEDSLSELTSQGSRSIDSISEKGSIEGSELEEHKQKTRHVEKKPKRKITVTKNTDTTRPMYIITEVATESQEKQKKDTEVGPESEPKPSTSRTESPYSEERRKDTNGVQKRKTSDSNEERQRKIRITVSPDSSDLEDVTLEWMDEILSQFQVFSIAAEREAELEERRTALQDQFPSTSDAPICMEKETEDSQITTRSEIVITSPIISSSQAVPEEDQPQTKEGEHSRLEEDTILQEMTDSEVITSTENISLSLPALSSEQETSSSSFQGSREVTLEESQAHTKETLASEVVTRLEKGSVSPVSSSPDTLSLCTSSPEGAFSSDSCEILPEDTFKGYQPQAEDSEQEIDSTTNL